MHLFLLISSGWGIPKSTSKGMAARAAGSCVFSASVGYLIYQKATFVQSSVAAHGKVFVRTMRNHRFLLIDNARPDAVLGGLWMRCGMEREVWDGGY